MFVAGGGKKIGGAVVGVGVGAEGAAAVVQAELEAVAGAAGAVLSDGMIRLTRWATPDVKGMDATGLPSSI